MPSGSVRWEAISWERRESWILYREERPSMVKYIVLLLIYIFLVGPGLYIFLKRKHKRSYLWGAICGLSVFFVLLIGILGRATNVYAPFISYSGIYSNGEISGVRTSR